MYPQYPTDDMEAVQIAMQVYEEIKSGSPSPSILTKRGWCLAGYIAGKITGDPDKGVVMVASNGEIELPVNFVEALRALAALEGLPGVDDCGPCPAVVGANGGLSKVKIPWLKLLVKALFVVLPLILDENGNPVPAPG